MQEFEKKNENKIDIYKNYKNKGSGVIVVTNDNLVALQHRDDVEGVSYRNMIGLFGGGYEDVDSSFEMTALREIEEELSIKIKEKDLELLMVYDIPSISKVRKTYVIRGINKSNLFIKEGQGIIFVKDKKELKDLNLIPETSFILEYYFTHFKKD